MFNPKMTLRIGDRVQVSRQVVDSYGYTDAKPFVLALFHAEVHHGKVGVITDIDTDYDPDSYPDCRIKTDDGETILLEICNVSKVLPESNKPTPVAKHAGVAKKTSPQCRMILEHLRSGNTITQRSALLDFGIMALPRRIADLKEAGYNIRSTMELNKLTGQRYARYSLVVETSKAA